MYQFGLNNRFPRFTGPSKFHGPPHPPPLGVPPPFGTIPPFPGPHHKHPFPMGREAFQEIRDYLLLLIISEYPDGITGYQLQEKYKFPRGTLIRTLQDLEEQKYLESREEIIEGRANKFYSVTEEGKKFLELLKLKWANLFGIMAEINPPEGIKRMIFEKIEEFETINDASEFFSGLRSWVKRMLRHIKKRVYKFEKSKEDLDNLIAEIENMDSLDKNKIKEMVAYSITKMEE